MLEKFNNTNLFNKQHTIGNKGISLLAKKVKKLKPVAFKACEKVEFVKAKNGFNNNYLCTII